MEVSRTTNNVDANGEMEAEVLEPIDNGRTDTSDSVSTIFGKAKDKNMEYLPNFTDKHLLLNWQKLKYN